MDNDKRTYTANRDNLTKQLDAAKAIEAQFTKFFEPLTEAGFPLAEGVGDAWNAAHDMVRSIEAEMNELDREWDYRLVDQNTRRLVAENID